MAAPLTEFRAVRDASADVDSPAAMLPTTTRPPRTMRTKMALSLPSMLHLSSCCEGEEFEGRCQLEPGEPDRPNLQEKPEACDAGVYRGIAPRMRGMPVPMRLFHVILFEGRRSTASVSDLLFPTSRSDDVQAALDCAPWFPSRLRQKCRNASRFLTTAETRTRSEEWRMECNRNRLHMRPGGVTPLTFAVHLQADRKSA